MDNFAGMVNRYLQDPTKHILSDQASTNDVLMQIEAIQRSIHGLTNKSAPDEIEAVSRDVTQLHNTLKDWLRLEAFIQRGYRAQYIVNYLSQVEAILSYASQKARVENHTVAGAVLNHSSATAAPDSLVPAQARRRGSNSVSARALFQQLAAVSLRW